MFGIYAFRGCNKLTEIYIPADLTLFGEGTCYGCTSLERIELSDANRYYTVKNGVLYTLDGKTIVFSPAGNMAGKNLTVPYDVVRIMPFAFANSSIKKLTIGSRVTDIDYSSFANSPGLLLVVDRGSQAERIAQSCDIDYIYSNTNRKGLYLGYCEYSGGTVYASVVNDRSTSINAVLYVSMMDYNGNFLGVIKRDISIGPMEKYTERVDNLITGTRRVKFMLWDENLTPLIKKWNNYDLYF